MQNVEISFLGQKRNATRLVETRRLPQHFGARAGSRKKPIEVAGYFWFLPAPQRFGTIKLQTSPVSPALRFSLLPQHTPPHCNPNNNLIRRSHPQASSSIFFPPIPAVGRISTQAHTRSAHRIEGARSRADFSFLFISQLDFCTHSQNGPRHWYRSGNDLQLCRHLPR